MSIELFVRKKKLHGVELWWVCKKVDNRTEIYTDVFAPTGYGWKSKAKAEQRAREIEASLNLKASIAALHPREMALPTLQTFAAAASGSQDASEQFIGMLRDLVVQVEELRSRVEQLERLNHE